MCIYKYEMIQIILTSSSDFATNFFLYNIFLNYILVTSKQLRSIEFVQIIFRSLYDLNKNLSSLEVFKMFNFIEHRI